MTTTTDPTLARLRRVRWAVRATLAFGVAASVAANVLHALPNPISQTIAGWPPLALLLTVELVSRVPLHRPLLAVVRVLATAVISGIAAYVSYWHMKGVAARYGETDASPYLLPISVDGLIVVASICLVELAARIRHLEEPATAPATVTPAAVWAASTQDTIPARPADQPVAAELDDNQVLTADPTAGGQLLLTRTTGPELAGQVPAIATLGGPTR
jgi:hypothetical protein